MAAWSSTNSKVQRSKLAWKFGGKLPYLKIDNRIRKAQLLNHGRAAPPIPNNNDSPHYNCSLQPHLILLQRPSAIKGNVPPRWRHISKMDIYRFTFILTHSHSLQYVLSLEIWDFSYLSCSSSQILSNLPMGDPWGALTLLSLCRSAGLHTEAWEGSSSVKESFLRTNSKGAYFKLKPI